MVTIKKIEAGNYLISDGRSIVKQGSGWYILSEDDSDFGPISTLAAAKEYVETGNMPLGQHNLGSSHGRRQSKKDFNAYLVSEAEQGNYGLLILYALLVLALCLLFAFMEAN